MLFYYPYQCQILLSERLKVDKFAFWSPISVSANIKSGLSWVWLLFESSVTATMQICIQATYHCLFVCHHMLHCALLAVKAPETLHKQAKCVCEARFLPCIFIADIECPASSVFPIPYTVYSQLQDYKSWKKS